MRRLCSLLLSGIILLFASCSNTPNDVNQVDFMQPLHTGNWWEFTSRDMVIVDSAYTEAFANDTVESTVRVQVQQDTTLSDTLILTKLNVRWSTPLWAQLPQPFYSPEEELQEEVQGVGYWRATSDGLYYYGYRGNSPLLPKSSSSFKAYFKTIGQLLFPLLHPGKGSDITFFDSSSQFLQYPLEVNSQWFFGAWSFDNEKRIVKKVREIKMIDVPAGTFKCAVVDVIYPVEGIYVTEYYSSIGLIKKEFLATDVSITTRGSYDPVAIYDSKRIYELQSYHTQ